MSLKTTFIRLSLAVGLSAIVFGVSIVIQGTLLFPGHLKELYSPARTTIHRFSLSSDGHRAGVLLMHVSRITPDRPANSVGVLSIGGSGCAFRALPLDFAPFNAVGARTGRYLFASSNDGRLIAFDLDSHAPPPRLLGIHDENFAHDLACTYDGSIVIAASHRFTTAWSPDAPGRLWRRDDIDVTCACFYGQTSRLYCGVVDGDGCELDGLTGATLRTFPTYCNIPVSIDVSLGANRLAVLSHDGAFVVTDLATNQPLWRRKFPQPAAGPRFSPGGDLVAAPSHTGEPALVVLSAATGQQQAQLAGAKAKIAGIAWSENGVVYAWDISGTITAWNVASGSLLHQFSVECVSANTASS